MSTPATARPRAAAALWASYLALLASNPVLAKAGTSSFLNFLQETTSTALSGGSPTDGLRKALKLATYGALIAGPMGHYLYDALNTVFDGSSAASKIGQLVGANIIVAPIQNAVYLAVMAIISGRPDVLGEIKRGFLPLMKLTWTVFPAIQLIAVKFLPPNLWLPYFNLMSFVFGVYINFKLKKEHQRRIAGQDKKKADDEE
ncbi:hypothetical protein BC828DRAFT_391884 [Blastocladiella britannica]|nr:hypothetical protein BC828DRAFT_391884 [Blastocladiella britannica]